jgi:hypothetical protein
VDVAILGGRKITLPSGWRRRTFVSLLGGAEIDARALPGEDAKLTIVTLLGGVHVKVPRGARVSVDGFSFLGGRRVETTPAEGPEIAVRAFTVLGGSHVTDQDTEPA